MSKPSDERYSPKHVLDAVREMFAPDLWLDPCTTPGNHTGADFFATPSGLQTKGGLLLDASDGLTCEWSKYAEQAFVNPPYSRGELARWVEKCIRETEIGVDVVALLPCDLGSRAGQRVADTADALCFVKGRLAFGSPEGQLAQGAKQPSIISYWGERAGRFARVFGGIGKVWTR